MDADSFKSLECNEAIKKLDSVKSSLKNGPLTGDELTEDEIISEVKKNLKNATMKNVELQNSFKGIFKEILDSLGEDLKLNADARQALFMDFPVFSDICAWIVGEIVSDEEIKIAVRPTINSQLIKNALNALKTKITTWNGGIKGYMEDRATEAFYHYNANVLEKDMYFPEIINKIVENSETHTQIALLLKSLMSQRPDTVNMAQPSQDEVCEKLYKKYDEYSGFNEKEKADFLIKENEFTQIFKWLPNVISEGVNDIVTLEQIKNILNDIMVETSILKENSSLKNYISIYGGDSLTANTSSDHIIGVINEIQNDQSTLEWMLNYVNSKQEPKSRVENRKEHHHDTTQEESRSTHKSKKDKKHLKDQKNDNNQHRKQQAQQVPNQIAEPGSIGYVPQSVKIDNKNQNNNTKPRSNALHYAKPNQTPTLPVFVNDQLTPADIYKSTPEYWVNKQKHDQSAAQVNNTNRNTDPGNNQVQNEVDPGYTKNIIGIAQSVTSQVLQVTAQLVKTSFRFIKNWLGW